MMINGKNLNSPTSNYAYILHDRIRLIGLFKFLPFLIILSQWLTPNREWEEKRMGQSKTNSIMSIVQLWACLILYNQCFFQAVLNLTASVVITQENLVLRASQAMAFNMASALVSLLCHDTCMYTWWCSNRLPTGPHCIHYNRNHSFAKYNILANTYIPFNSISKMHNLFIKYVKEYQY